MFAYREFPNPPMMAEVDANSIGQGLPWKALLALPEYVTRDPAIPWFHLPVAAAKLLGGWKPAQRVLLTRVWAPAWDAEFVASLFADRIFKKTTSLSARLRLTKDLNEITFFNPPNENWKYLHSYEIVFFVGKCVSSGPSGCFLDLGKHGGGKLNASDLLDRLSLTRLLILQTASPKHFEDALKLAEEIVGHAGPALLVVRGEDASSLDGYFYHLFQTILQNKPLDEAATIPGSVEPRKLDAHLFCGAGGRNLLRLDRWMESLTRQIEELQQNCGKNEATLLHLRKDTLSYLYEGQRDVLLSQIEDEVSRVHKPAGKLRRLAVELNGFRTRPWEHKTKDVLGIVNLNSEVGAVAKETFSRARALEPESQSQFAYGFVGPLPYAHLENEFQKLAGVAPRVLNAGFAETAPTKQVLGLRDPLLAGQEYDLLVDVGPRWNKTTSLVTGNARFPEEALPPDLNGYLVQVVMISEDFSPLLSSTDIWVPRYKGRSYPIKNGERAPSPGPASLHVRAPTFPERSSDKIRTARGRLCLYYENNLLQSALVKVGIARIQAVELEEDNSIEVDFVLNGSFQGVERFASRRLKQRIVMDISELRADRKEVKVPPGEDLELNQEEKITEYPVALNVTLNDDGNGQHRILIKDHPELPPVWRPYDPSASTQILLNARQELLNCFFQRDDGYNVLRGTEGLNDKNGKDYEQFTRDLYKMALLGESLYNAVFSKIRMSDTGKDWDVWEGEFRQTLASTSVIQVARTGSAGYVLPWALLYDYKLPNKDRIQWCDVINEWRRDGIRTKSPERCCPHKNEPKHGSNIICPYGFWGLRHFIEQPISPLYKSGNNKRYELPPEVTNEIHVSATVKLAVAVTRDAELDQRAIATHVKTLQQSMSLSPPNEADDWDKVCSMLEAPEIAYFLCHGEYDATRVAPEPYLGVGLRDASLAHRVYPNELLSWARPPSPKQWRRDRRPLIFINGCHTTDLKPEDILDFVDTFGLMGASGVIGTEISVRLPLAIAIGESLLRRIAGDATVGEAMYRVRWELANKGNMLGLAYTPYCLADLHTVKDAH